jgi:transposase-like protein
MRRIKLRIGGPRPRRLRRRRSGEWSPSFTPGASVSKVAQRYGVKANLLFTWRCQEGRSNAVGGTEPLQPLPVTVGDAGTAAGAAGRTEIVLNSADGSFVRVGVRHDPNLFAV